MLKEEISIWKNCRKRNY